MKLTRIPRDAIAEALQHTKLHSAAELHEYTCLRRGGDIERSAVVVFTSREGLGFGPGEGQLDGGEPVRFVKALAATLSVRSGENISKYDVGRAFDSQNWDTFGPKKITRTFAPDVSIVD